MKIYLVRHGDSSQMASDNQRPLSMIGKDEINRLAQFIAPLNIHVSHIYHSEKLRARETAEILATAITSKNALETMPELDPLAPIAPVAKDISTWENDAMLVGHMPFMGHLVSKLTMGDEDLDTVLFATGTIVCLEQLDQSRWLIRWVLNPELLNP